MVKKCCSRAPSRLSAVGMDPVDGPHRPGAALRPWNPTPLHPTSLGTGASTTQMAEGQDAGGVTGAAACDGGKASGQPDDASASVKPKAEVRGAARGNTVTPPAGHRTPPPRRRSDTATQVGPDTEARFKRELHAKGADGRGTRTDGTSESSGAPGGCAAPSSNPHPQP